MKILVTGSGGQLGGDVVKEARRRNLDCLGVTRKEFDLTNEEQTRDFILRYRPGVVIHCAAYTAVDKAEDERALCFAVNETATARIAEACEEISAKLLYVSTDYVFAGDGDAFYETDDPPAPVNVYGKSKLAGERAVAALAKKHFIVRVSWVFGNNGNHFVRAMLNLAKERDEIRVVDDQYGSPTYTADLAPLLLDMAETDRFGVYHATNEGVCTWAEFAREIFRKSHVQTKVLPIPSRAYPTKAARPHNSRLSKTKLEQCGFCRLPPWQDALRRYLEEIE